MLADVKNKINELLAERETIIEELNNIQMAYDKRNQRLIEISGALKILNELNEVNESNEDSKE